MFYHITGLCPRTDISTSRCNFSIWLYPQWQEAVKWRALTQDQVNVAIERLGRRGLDGCGYDRIYDPEQSPVDRWETQRGGKPVELGPKARPLYGPESIRVTWGEWGPEHITVPGNACGLDLGTGTLAPYKGRVLHPHNIDNLSQVVLLLTVFTWFAEDLILNYDKR